ncbi:hypothetical protein EZS27_041787 [termite gut metagenome]|uniref:Uncharacterized protein n=1 Tax=termite gut metagenome TaxID=433724 RepID=A0A5J4PD37_9ZZZZ
MDVASHQYPVVRSDAEQSNESYPYGDTEVYRVHLKQIPQVYATKGEEVEN